ncbi:MAG: hypothetical protein AABX11_05565 [Nanoarchaeota archaeon]
MAESQNPEIVPQKVYSTLEKFIENQNNFYLHFCSDCFTGKEVYRTKAHFRRFREQYSQMERRLTRKVSVRSLGETNFPNQELWEASKLMAKLVYVGDFGVDTRHKKDGTLDDWIIYR